MRRAIQFSTGNGGYHALREPVCTAPSGLLAARDLPAAHIRGVMW